MEAWRWIRIEQGIVCNKSRPEHVMKIEERAVGTSIPVRRSLSESKFMSCTHNGIPKNSKIGEPFCKIFRYWALS